MVDDYIDIFEEEDLVKTLPTPGVQRTDTGVLDINLEPETIPDIADPLGDAARYIIREGAEKDITGYPKTIDLGDPTGIGIFRTPEQKAETSVSLAPAYRTLSEITDFVGFDIPQFLNKPIIPVGKGEKISIAAYSPTAALGSLGLEFLIGEGPGQTFRTMEAGRSISPFQLAELALVGFDAGTLGVGGTAAAKTLYRWLTKTVNKSPEEAFTMMKNNPELAEDAMVGKSIDELTDEEYEKLSVSAAVPPRKKKQVAKQTKEPSPNELEFNSLMFRHKNVDELDKDQFEELLDDSEAFLTKQKDSPKLKSPSAPLTKEVKEAIATRINKIDFSKADPKKEHLFLKIVNEERAKAGYPPTKTPVNIQTKSLEKQKYITKKKKLEIKKHGVKRSNVAGNEVYAQKQLLRNTSLADNALTLAKELQAQSDTPIVMPAVTLYNKLMKKYPKEFLPLSDSGKSKVINTIKVLRPEINNYLAKSGKEVGGLKYSDETLGVIEGGKEAADRTALVKKFKEVFPDEPITPLGDPLTDLSPLGEDVFDPRILDLKRTDKAGQIDLLQNPKFKFYEFLRDSLPTTDLDTLFDTVKIGDAGDLANPAQKLFNQFKKIEDVRKKVSKKIRPFLKRIFPVESTSKTGKNIASVQIAHTFEKTKMKLPKREGVKKEIGFDPEKFIGQGVNPDFLYLDISPYNQGVQKSLENQANLAGKQGDFNKLAAIQELMEIMGVEGQQAGVTVGKKRKLSTKLKGLINELDKIGDPLPERKELLEAIKILESSGAEGFAYGGLVNESIFSGDEDGFMAQDDMVKNFSYGGSSGQFSESILSDDDEDIDVKEIQMEPGFESVEDLDIFEEAKKEGFEEVQVANLMLPFFKLFGKAPDNVVSSIPTPKPNLKNPTKKQNEALVRRQEQTATEDIFDPTPEDIITEQRGELPPITGVSTTPITKTPMTSVFYSDIERALSNAPKQFNSKQEVFDYLNKQNIRKSEATDYRIPQVLRLMADDQPIVTSDLIAAVRSAPIRGIRVHATGYGEDLINTRSSHPDVRYEGYRKEGFINGTQRERVLVIPKKMLGKDEAAYPKSLEGEGGNIANHDFGQGDDMFVIGWSRLTDRYGKLPQKIEGPKTAVNTKRLQAALSKNERSLKGLYAEAQNKIQRLAGQRGMNQADIDEIMEDFGTGDFRGYQMSVINKYADQLNEVSPGLVDQMDELIVKNRDLLTEIDTAKTPNVEDIVRVTFADEIQSDLMQAAATRKKFLAGTLRRLKDQGKTVDSLQEYDDLNRRLMEFYEEYETVFRPTTKTEAEVDVLRKSLEVMDQEVDSIVNKYIATREINPKELERLRVVLQDNMDNMLEKVLTIDSDTMAKLLPDIPFKNRSEWADAVVKKDLYEAAYRKFVLKDPDAADYYAVSPGDIVAERAGFRGNTATPTKERLVDKERMLNKFKETGAMYPSQLKGVGMNEFYGGPDAMAPKKYYVADTDKPIKDKKGEIIGYERVDEFAPTEELIRAEGFRNTGNRQGKKYRVMTEQKHYTSDLEKILKKQAQDNNSEILTMPVQLGQGSRNVYRITDQNGNTVATLSDEQRALEIARTNPLYQIQPIAVPDEGAMKPVFAIKITEEMLEPYITHKAQGGLVEDIDIFEVA